MNFRAIIKALGSLEKVVKIISRDQNQGAFTDFNNYKEEKHFFSTHNELSQRDNIG